ncbi:MAG: hypothetical protein WAX44_00850 [Minisyncoccia bacterium]
MKKNLKFLIYAPQLLFPVFIFAQSLAVVRTLVTEFGNIVRLLIPIVFGLAFMFFMWGVATFILNAGDTKLREEGKQRMIWGVVGMFVIMSIFGIVAFINTALGIPQTGCPIGSMICTSL